MRTKLIFPIVVVLFITTISCSAYRIDDSRVEMRPLGRKLQVYQPPRQDSESVPTSQQLEEPTGEITLEHALSLALMRNPELAASAWEIRAYEARAMQAGLFPNPDLEFEMEEFGGSGERRGLDAAETTFQLSQLIELGGKRKKRFQLAGLKRDLINWDFEAKRIELFSEVKRAFIDVLASQERLALTEELLDLSKQMYNAVSERVKAGKVSPVEEVKARVTVSTSKIDWERAKRDLEASKKRLAATWGGTAPTFTKVAGQIDVLTPIPSFEQLTRMIAQNPDVARWVVEMEQRRASLKLEEAKRIPDLTLSGGLRHYKETNDRALVLGVSIPLTIFNRNQGGVLEAQTRLIKANAERRAAEMRVLTALAAVYGRLSTAYNEASVLKTEVLPAAQAAFAASQEGYRRGKFGILDVLDAQRTLFEAKNQYLEALAAYHESATEVERLVGQSLESLQSN